MKARRAASSVPSSSTAFCFIRSASDGVCERAHLSCIASRSERITSSSSATHSEEHRACSNRRTSTVPGHTQLHRIWWLTKSSATDLVNPEEIAEKIEHTRRSGPAVLVDTRFTIPTKPYAENQLKPNSPRLATCPLTQPEEVREEVSGEKIGLDRTDNGRFARGVSKSIRNTLHGRCYGGHVDDDAPPRLCIQRAAIEGMQP